MDKKSTILVSFLVLAFLASIGASFYKYLVREDFVYSTDEALFDESLASEEQ